MPLQRHAEPVQALGYAMFVRWPMLLQGKRPDFGLAFIDCSQQAERKGSRKPGRLAGSPGMLPNEPCAVFKPH